MENRQFTLENVQKRDGRVLPYDRNKISTALLRAFQAENMTCTEESLTELVLWIEDQIMKNTQSLPVVEEIQDYAELALQTKGYFNVAKAYILFRNHRSRTSLCSIPNMREPTKKDSFIFMIWIFTTSPQPVPRSIS